MQRDPRNFSPYPSSFWPERWLLAGSASDGPKASTSILPAGFTHNEHAFLPFSHGPLNCVGKNLAMHEMRIVVAGLVQRFHFKAGASWPVKPSLIPATGDKGNLAATGDAQLREYEKDFRDYFITEHGAVPVVIDMRDR